jgi:hypothetical protein
VSFLACVRARHGAQYRTLYTNKSRKLLIQVAGCQATQFACHSSQAKSPMGGAQHQELCTAYHPPLVARGDY